MHIKCYTNFIRIITDERSNIRKLHEILNIQAGLRSDLSFVLEVSPAIILRLTHENRTLISVRLTLSQSGKYSMIIQRDLEKNTISKPIACKSMKKCCINL